jgi:hypothetical protein
MKKMKSLETKLDAIDFGEQELLTLLRSKEGKDRFPTLVNGLTANADQVQLVSNVNAFISHVGKLHRRASISQLSESLTAKFVETKLGVTARALRHARDPKFLPLLQPICKQNYPKGTTKVKVNPVEAKATLEWAKHEGLDGKSGQREEEYFCYDGFGGLYKKYRSNFATVSQTAPTSPLLRTQIVFSRKHLALQMN